MTENDKKPGFDPEFDRQAYLRDIRKGILKNLGLPEDTKPEMVMQLLEIKQKMSKTKPE